MADETQWGPGLVLGARTKETLQVANNYSLYLYLITLLHGLEMSENYCVLVVRIFEGGKRYILKNDIPSVAPSIHRSSLTV